MDSIKEAFLKVKQDVSFLQEELYFVKKDVLELKDLVQELVSISGQLLFEKEKKESTNVSEKIQTQEQENTTQQGKIPTESDAFKPLKYQKTSISIGNEGVPTDRQTNQQTNQQTEKTKIYEEKRGYLEGKESSSKKDSFEEAAEILESLDNLKKELRIKFKKLTDQELLVFSTLYQLEEQTESVDYKLLSNKLKLTESSIRDYVGKLIKKGIPVDKIKINNKMIQLKISPNLKKVASLQTILTLRDI